MMRMDVWPAMVLCATLAAPLAPVRAEPLDIDALDQRAEWRKVNFDAAFETETGRTLDLYFDLVVPVVPGAVRLEYRFDDPDAVAHFAWLTPDDDLIESVMVVVAQGRDGPMADPMEEARGAIDAYLRDRVRGPEPQELGHRSRTYAGWQIAEWAGRQTLYDGRTVMVRIICVPAPDNYTIICLSGRSNDDFLPPGDAPGFLGFNFTTFLVRTLVMHAARTPDGTMHPL